MREQFSPWRLFVTVILITFITEAAVMLLLPYVVSHDVHPLLEALIDSTILTIVSSVFLWLLFVGPLRNALMNQTAQADAIMDTAAEGIITIDEHGIIQSFNRAAEGLFGYTRAEVIGANVKMLVPPPHAVQHDTYLANYLRTGQAKIIGNARDVDAVRKDGTVFPIALNVTELHLGRYRGFTGVLRDITERKLAEDQIRHLAHHDMVTGLPNRMLFNDRLRQAMALAKRERHELALLYIDLDKFKTVNDNFGHDVGDGLLRHVAERLQRHTRESDTVARIGGDEFAVILPTITSRGDIALVAGKIIAALCTPFDLDGHNETAQIGVSIGIAIYPTDAQDIEALVKAGDVAMYKAKRAGNSFRFCEA